MTHIAVLDPEWPVYVTELQAAGLAAVGAAHPSDILELEPSPEVLLAAPDLAAQVIHRVAGLRWVQSTWAGVEPIVAGGVPDHVTVTRAVGVFGPAMREFVLGYLLAHTLRVHDRMHATAWDPTPPGLLAQTRLGVMGTGSIGAAIAEAARALEMDVVGLSRSGAPVSPFRRVYPTEQRLAFAQGLDHLVVALPRTPATSRIVDADLLAVLAPGATLINVGRGASVDTDAVVEALGLGHLSLAVLDVLDEEPLAADSELWRVPGLIITSHTAATSVPSTIVELFLANLARHESGRPLAGVLDPERGY